MLRMKNIKTDSEYFCNMAPVKI